MAEPDQHEPDGNPAEQPPPGKKRRRKDDAVPQFRRGQPIATRKLADKKLKGRLKHTEALAEEAATSAAAAHQWLLPVAPGGLEAEGMERTWQFSQSDIVQAYQQAAPGGLEADCMERTWQFFKCDIVQEVETGAGRKVFDLSLGELGPYTLDFTRSGRFCALAGRKGHLAILDWHRLHTICEVQVKETTRDVHFLHNEQFFAAAQRKYAYIYDKRGVEVHCLKDHTEPKRLEFLPYHFLLASIGDPGILHYQDTSTGQLVAQHRTRLGPCGVMAQNPWNAVLGLGHANGTVTMWTPNITTPAVRLLCHRGPVSALAVEPGGNQMVTAGVDGQVRVWDVRALKPMHSYFSRASPTSLDISQRGMLAVGSQRRIQVWQDAITQKAMSPYLVHELPVGQLSQLAFCPYEDILAAGTGGGLSSMLVPGAGEPNFDSRVADPFQARKARREMEVVQLLDKLQPDMITLDANSVGQVRKEPKDVQKERQAEATAANAERKAAERAKADDKTRMKGKNRPSRRAARKRDNIIEDRKPALRQRIAEQQGKGKSGVKQKYAPNARKVHGDAPAQKKEVAVPDSVPRALHGFYTKS